MRSRRAFTLIELLVVIAIIAILAVVVVLTLNPAQLLAQSRDANRVSDLATLDSAVGLYQTDQSGAASYSLGTSTVFYVSVPDSSSTCGDLGLPALPSGDSYGCSSNGRNTAGQGWLPVDFQNISSGAPFGSLPMDPVNQTSSGLYYLYSTTGSQYEVLATMESQKYRGNVTGGLGNGVDAVGSGVGAGPSGWWPLNEGSGLTAIDASGAVGNGTWNGTQAGTSGYYSSGISGQWAGYFNGSNDYVAIAPSMTPFPQETITMWVNEATTSYGGLFSYASEAPLIFDYGGRAQMYWGSYPASSCTTPMGSWTFCAWEWDGAHLYTYANAALAASVAFTPGTSSVGHEAIGAYQTSGGSQANFNPGSIADVRVYNRVLTPAEILAIYNAKN